MSSDPYKKTAKQYDRYVEPSIAALRQIGMKMYQPKEGMHVLDVGCGTGTNLMLYHEAGCKAFGIESPKTAEVSGMEVKNLYDAGRIKDIAVYCSRDIYATYQLYKIWEKHLAHP